MSRVTRRRFLELAAGAALAACGGPAVEPPLPSPKATTASAGTPSTDVPSAVAPTTDPNLYPPPLPPTEIQVTATDALYTQSYRTTPSVDATAWRLTIDGLVQNPITLSLADIKAKPAEDFMRTLECIGNPVGGNLIGNVVWTGTRIRPIFEAAVVMPQARYVRFTSADGYQTAVDLKFFQDDNAFLAYDINGAPLPADHGYPLRLFFAGSYGQKMPKWITRIELIDQEFEGFWERQGWSDNAQVRTNAIIVQPRPGASYANQRMFIWGVAYAGKRAIVKVEIQIDNGGWQPADLLSSAVEDVWTQWKITWNPSPGSHKIQVRATDSAGMTQDRQAAGPLDSFPNGSESIHQIYVKIAAA